MLADGEYTVEFWETYEGNVIGTMMVTVDNRVLELTIPDFEILLKDLALIVRPVSW